MAIQFIDNQPITWRTDWATDSDCKTSNELACTIYSNNDTLFAQWQQTPCGTGSNKLCNPTFTNGNTDLVTNGSFTTNSTGWTLGTGVTRDAVNKRIQFPGTTLATALSQTLTMSAGNYYQVTYTIGGNTTGSITAKLDGTSGVTRFSPGTYTEYIQYTGGTNSIVFSTSGFNGWIDDISVKLNGISSGCWQTSFPSRWQINTNGSITKVAGLADTLGGTINSFNVGSYLKLSFRVSGLSAGSMGFEMVGVSLLDTITTDGIYTYYTTAPTVGNINFHPDANFDGTISDLSVYEYSNFFSVTLKDSHGAIVADLSSDVELFEDKIILKYDMYGIDPGCYVITIGDACGYSLSQDLITNYSFTDATKWNVDLTVPGGANGQTGSVAGGKLTLGTSAVGGYNEWRVTDTVSGDIFPTAATTMVIQWTVAMGAVTASPNIYMNDKNSQYHLLVTSAAANTTYTGTITLSGQQVVSGINPQLRVYLTPAIASRTIEINDFRLQLMSYIPGQMTTYDSNCIEVIDYPDSEKCTQWIGGTNGEDSFGFHFNPNDATPFQIGARVRSMLINPKYSGDINRYSNASGKNIITKSSSGKLYTLFIDYTDEHTHDWLRLAVLSDTVKIGKYSGQANIDYVSTDGDYSPEWPSALGNWPSAQARIEVQKQTDVLYNNNAG